MRITRISDWDLEERLGLDSRPIVVTFMRAGERGHRAIREELQYLADSYPDARFYDVDLLENPSLEGKFDLRRGQEGLRLPLTLVFMEGVEKARHAGALLVRVVERALGPPPEPDDGEGGGPW